MFLGDYPEIEFVPVPGSDATVKVTEKIKGLPTFNDFAINFIGR